MGKDPIWPKKIIKKNHQTQHHRINYWYDKLADVLHTLKKPRDKWKNQVPVTWLPIPIRLIQSSTGFAIYIKETGKKYLQYIWLCLLESSKSTKQLCKDSSLFYYTAEKRICLLFLRPQKGIICNTETTTLFSVSRELQTAARENKKQPQM